MHSLVLEMAFKVYIKVVFPRCLLGWPRFYLGQIYFAYCKFAQDAKECTRDMPD
jgi:hypothetical protein